MRKYFYLSAIFLFSNLLPNATTAQLTKHSIQLSAGFSTHGTGDMLGVSADVGYDHVFNKRFDMTHALTTTIHSDHDEFPPVADQWNIINDRGINWTVAGMQITSMDILHPFQLKTRSSNLEVELYFDISHLLFPMHMVMAANQSI